MKSAVVLAGLIAFAAVNTVFLGAYLFSGHVAGELSAGVTFGLLSTEGPVATTFSTTTTASSSSSSLLSPSSAASSVSGSNATFGSGLSFGSNLGSLIASSTPAPASTSLMVLALTKFFEIHSLVLAPTSWIFVGGMWIWRGRMKSRWMDLGFDSDVFGLFVRMKGAKTRIRLLDALSVPKDRLQLAQELGLDWKGVDRHITILRKYGFVDDRVVYGKVRMYELTATGKSLLYLLEELSRADKGGTANSEESFAPLPLDS